MMYLFESYRIESNRYLGESNGIVSWVNRFGPSINICLSIINTIGELCGLWDKTFMCDVVNYSDNCQLLSAISASSVE